MNTKCTVSNKSAGSVVYKIPEMNIRREFQPHETRKNVDVAELEALSQLPGGKAMLCNYLFVDDAEIINYLLNAEPVLEYWLTEDQLPNWMVTCSLDEFKDALDFAPLGTKDLIKKLAVNMPLNDIAKREAIKEQLGYDVTASIEAAKDDIVTAEEAPTQRRVNAAAATPARRASTSTVKKPAETIKETAKKEG